MALIRSRQGRSPAFRQAIAASLAAVFLGILPLLPGSAFAQRPLDTTDATVISHGRFELEVQPAGFLRAGSNSKMLIAPDYVATFGLLDRFELSAVGILRISVEDPLPAGTERTVFSPGVLAKVLLREGSLQGGSGPSLALEGTFFFPEVNGVDAIGGTVIGAITHDAVHGYVHGNLAWAGRGDGAQQSLIGTIAVQGPLEDTLRPVVEAFFAYDFEQEVGTYSGLFGLQWQLLDSLMLDAGLRLGWVDPKGADGNTLYELRGGLTWNVAIPGIPRRPTTAD